VNDYTPVVLEKRQRFVRDLLEFVYESRLDDGTNVPLALAQIGPDVLQTTALYALILASSGPQADILALTRPEYPSAVPSLPSSTRFIHLTDRRRHSFAFTEVERSDS